MYTVHCTLYTVHDMETYAYSLHSDGSIWNFVDLIVATTVNADVYSVGLEKGSDQLLVYRGID